MGEPVCHPIQDPNLLFSVLTLDRLSLTTTLCNARL